LKTIGESTELGSGFKIAMRDLEIRGAGNLLGPIQSGHIAAVGYDLYCQLVNEAIAELNGVEPETPPEISLDLPVDANIPVDYIAREDLRLEAYRRLAAVTSMSEVEDIRSEWEDRYGPVPPRAEALLVVARLRARCIAAGISEISVTKGTGFGGPAWMVKVGPVQLPASKVVRLERLYKGSAYRVEPKMLQLALPKKADVAGQLLAALVDLLPEVESAPVG
jgi:transcription-repair coupling factor (superfamily II helicase)